MSREIVTNAELQRVHAHAFIPRDIDACARTRQSYDMSRRVEMHHGTNNAPRSNAGLVPVEALDARAGAERQAVG